MLCHADAGWHWSSETHARAHAHKCHWSSDVESGAKKLGSTKAQKQALVDRTVDWEKFTEDSGRPPDNKEQTKKNRRRLSTNQ